MADAGPEDSTVPSWTDLTRRQRSLQVGQTVATVAFAWAVLFGLYYLVPFDDRTAGESVVRLIVGIVGFIVRVGHRAPPGEERGAADVASHPGARRGHRGLPGRVRGALPVPVAGLRSSFSEPLNHTGGLYLTITVFSTVGFGDITPETDLARVVVSVQMLLDLVVIGAVVRLLLNAAKTGMDDDM